MRNVNLRTKILVPVGLIIFVMLGVSTLLHVQDLRREYLNAIKSRAEGLGYVIVQLIEDRFQGGLTVQEMFGILSLRCAEVFDSYKENNVEHVAVIDKTGTVIAHNDLERRNTPLENPQLLDLIQRQEVDIALSGTTYHALIPVFSQQGEYLATVDIGFPQHLIAGKIQQLLLQAAGLFVLLLLVTFFTISLLVHALITKPIRALVTVGQQLAQGNLVQTFDTTHRQDEIALLGIAFNQIAAYMQDIAEVASHIADGVLTGEVHVRSEHDVLGKAVQKMLSYLQNIANVMGNIAEGKLTQTVQARSEKDAFGLKIQAMTKGLHTLVTQIRTSAEQLASTEESISSLATQDIDIVQNVTTAVENMVSTVNEMGASAEEVAHNVDALSSSMEESAASVSQMTMSISHIASKTTDLTEQSQQTIDSLNTTVTSLEDIVNNTDASKRLSQETIQDARDGQQAVEQVMSSVQIIQQTMTTAVTAINQFAQRSQDIDKILDVIRDITDQTSLLALNASIIAAQAGSHGRGFAVVADEIKSLASGVGNSTKDIAAIVQTLQEETRRVVQTIHEGATNVEQGMQQTQQAQEVLKNILTSAQRSSQVVTEIAETLHDLRSTSRNVLKAMEQVNIMTLDITRATNEQKTTTTQINQAIAHVNDMVSHIQHATNEQLTGVRQLLQITNDVTNLIVQNLESSQNITHGTTELSSQAEILLRSVDRFTLQEKSMLPGQSKQMNAVSTSKQAKNS
ncbi:HAMP domain-containing protein [candidate division KSB3 bacterium]|uniref:HAMP domain-containing protein n=1 Tax=candidate division KSB3 bacterium TaxID=2044937 RepID=A0A9D5K0B4_9BACT|nr:HAMP domain-containing protein [candidate division KSB3 bacterium]MBD3327261.1 HAMP domain-containing protein [candidate division KSB3 bacterium]